MKTAFTRRQRRIFLGCFLAYFSAYMVRLNLPAALNSMMSELALSGVQCGLLQTVFALVYACGQFVNGAIVDRVSARRHILLGLGFSSLFNLLFGFASKYWILVVLWALNGAAQSMIWTPVVKLIAVWFKGRRRARASFGITMTLIAGNLCAWLLSGVVASTVSWRWSFVLPAVWVIPAAAVSRLILADHPEPDEDLGEDEADRKRCFTGKSMPFRATLFTTGLVQILVCCVGNGFVRDGIITWAPTIIAHFNRADAPTPVFTPLAIPLLNLVGVLLAQRVYAAFNGNARRCTGVLMLLSAALAFLLIPACKMIYPCVLLLGLCCSATNGINPMLSTFVPMEYERVGRVGLVAGMVDAFIYIGSSLAGIVTGAVSDAAGWQPVFALWGAAALVACVAGLTSVRGVRQLDRWRREPRKPDAEPKIQEG